MNAVLRVYLETCLRAIWLAHYFINAGRAKPLFGSVILGQIDVYGNVWIAQTEVIGLVLFVVCIR